MGSVLRSNWLALTYIGGVLLLVARSNALLRRLDAFAVTGRMALTNYMIQVIVIDLAFSRYALGLSLDATYAPLAALVLFGVELALCRWLAGAIPFRAAGVAVALGDLCSTTADASGAHGRGGAGTDVADRLNAEPLSNSHRLGERFRASIAADRQGRYSRATAQ